MISSFHTSCAVVKVIFCTVADTVQPKTVWVEAAADSPSPWPTAMLSCSTLCNGSGSYCGEVVQEVKLAKKLTLPKKKKFPIGSWLHNYNYSTITTTTQLHKLHYKKWKEGRTVGLQREWRSEPEQPQHKSAWPAVELWWICTKSCSSSDCSCNFMTWTPHSYSNSLWQAWMAGRQDQSSSSSALLLFRAFRNTVPVLSSYPVREHEEKSSQSPLNLCATFWTL